MRGRILLTGATGQLGEALLRELAGMGEVFAPVALRWTLRIWIPCGE